MSKERLTVALLLPNVKHAILFIKKAWDHVKVSTINNCWSHCGFLKDYKPQISIEEEIAEHVRKLDNTLFLR